MGAYKSQNEGELELDRIAILGKLDGRWFTATMIVDGDERVHGMLGQQAFGSERCARLAYAQAR